VTEVGSAQRAASGAPGGTFANPVLRGGFPDPSVCRVGDDFYLCNSSFEYFPGLPIHRSRDLVNWEWVGYGLHRPEQVQGGAVNLVDVKQEDGIQAPSLHYHKGVFYIIATCVYRPPGTDEGTCNNFIITATDIRGPWSQPHLVEGAPGIDPDLFFDDDGKVWYVGTHSVEPPSFPGEGEIWCQEIDLTGWRLVGGRHALWRGALHGCMFVEGPHMYKIRGKYYLMVAEGGTGFNHAVTIAVSDNVTGPFLGNERNPILTSRNLSSKNWVVATGHADLVELPDGRWFMLCLGVQGGSNMGRETHLAPVIWEEEQEDWKEKHWWPVVAPETGRVEHFGNPTPFEGTLQGLPSGFRDDFASETLGFEWNFRRLPRPGAFSLSERPGFLRLRAGPERIAPNTACGLLGVRQRERCFTYRARMEFSPMGEAAEAGVSLFQKDDSYINLTVRKAGEGHLALLSVAEPGQAAVVSQTPLPGYGGTVEFQVEVASPGCCYELSLRLGGGPWWAPAFRVDGDKVRSKGYTGAYCGLYCTANGERDAADCADFDWVEVVTRPPSE